MNKNMILQKWTEDSEVKYHRSHFMIFSILRTLEDILFIKKIPFFGCTGPQLWHPASLPFTAACHRPDQGWTLGPLCWECRALVTGPPEKSWKYMLTAYILEKAVATHSILLPGKSHGRRNMVGCSPWGRQELDTTEQLHFHFSLSCIGEGNGSHFSVLAWRIPGTGEPGGLSSMRSHRVGPDWSDLTAAAAYIC